MVSLADFNSMTFDDLKKASFARNTNGDVCVRVIWYQGPQWPSGWAQWAQGAQWSQGTQGSQWYQGYQGNQGNQWYQGYQGYQWNQGNQGNQGNQWYQGYQGASWIWQQGYQWAQWPQGNQWNQWYGNQWYQGYQGAQGPQGVQWFQWFQGFQWSSERGFDAIVDASGGWDYLLVETAINAWRKNIFVRNGSYTETYRDLTGKIAQITWESKEWVHVTFSHTTANTGGTYINVTASLGYIIKNIDFIVTFRNPNNKFIATVTPIDNSIRWKFENCRIEYSIWDSTAWATRYLVWYWINFDYYAWLQKFSRVDWPGKWFIEVTIVNNQTYASWEDTVRMHRSRMYYDRCRFIWSWTFYAYNEAYFKDCFIDVKNMGITGSFVWGKTNIRDWWSFTDDPRTMTGNIMFSSLIDNIIWQSGTPSVLWTVNVSWLFRDTAIDFWTTLSIAIIVQNSWYDTNMVWCSIRTWWDITINRWRVSWNRFSGNGSLIFDNGGLNTSMVVSWNIIYKAAICRMYYGSFSWNTLSQTLTVNTYWYQTITGNTLYNTWLIRLESTSDNCVVSSNICWSITINTGSDNNVICWNQNTAMADSGTGNVKTGNKV